MRPTDHRRFGFRTQEYLVWTVTASSDNIWYHQIWFIYAQAHDLLYPHCQPISPEYLRLILQARGATCGSPVGRSFVFHVLYFQIFVIQSNTNEDSVFINSLRLSIKFRICQRRPSGVRRKTGTFRMKFHVSTKPSPIYIHIWFLSLLDSRGRKWRTLMVRMVNSIIFRVEAGVELESLQKGSRVRDKNLNFLVVERAHSLLMIWVWYSGGHTW